MEILRTNLPHESLPLPIELFHAEIWIVIFIVLATLLYYTYTGWKKFESSDSTVLKNDLKPKGSRKWVWFWGDSDSDKKTYTLTLFDRIRRLDPSDTNFGEEIARLFIQYAELMLGIKIPPTLTAREARHLLPGKFADTLEEIRDIRYAPKHSIEGKCRLIQTSVLALMESYGIR